MNCDVGEHIIEIVLPDLEKGLKMDELFLSCHFSSGDLDSCRLSEYKNNKLRPLKISKSILVKVRDEIREIIKEKLGDK